MSITADDMSVSPDTLDFAIDDFYALPTKESAERLARVVRDYNQDDMISDGQTQEILAIVSDFFEDNI